MKMDDTELKSIVSQEIENSIGWDGGPLSAQRARLMEFYEGAPLGNISDPTRSQIVDRTAMSVVEWSIPALLRLFTASDKIFEYAPTRPDEYNTAQAVTEYCNYIFLHDNRGEQILNMWMKTALIQRTGYVLVRWVQDKTYQMNTYTGLSEQEYQEVTKGDDVEIVEEVAYPNPDPMFQNFGQDSQQPGAMLAGPQAGQPAPPMLHDVRVKTWTTQGRVKIDHVAPENVMISHKATETVLDGSAYAGFRDTKTVSDLRAMGIPEDVIQDAREASQPNISAERLARYAPQDGVFPDLDSNRTDEAMQDVALENNFIRVDRDGDGIAELRFVLTAGNGSVILIDEEIDELPLCALCPIPMPFRHSGYSVVDLVSDLQQIKTVILQQTLDSLYLSTTPRLILNEMGMSANTLDDLDNDFPGAVLRVRDPNAVTPLVIPFLGQQALGVLEYIDTIQAERTGISQSNNGLDPDDLNVTATGIAMKMNAANQRLEYIARVFADQIRVLGERIFGLVSKHQQEARMIRITGQFVNVDPRSWHESYDVNCTSGIGTGDKSQIAGQISSILQIQQTIIGFQKGLNGPLVSGQNVYEALQCLTHAMGFKQQFFSDPNSAQAQQQPPPPDPEMVKAQSQAQLDQMRTKAQLDLQTQESQARMAQQEREFQFKMQLEDRDAQHQMQLEQMREESKRQLEMARLQQQSRVAELKAVTRTPLDQSMV